MTVMSLQLVSAEAVDTEQIKDTIVSVATKSAEQLSTTERIVDKYSGKLMGVITSLAESLQVPVEHVYKVLVLQQVAEGISGILPLLGLIICIIMLKSQYNNVGWSDSSFYNEDWEGETNAEKKVKWREKQFSHRSILFIATSLICSVFFIITLHTLSDSIIQIVNPEYGAIQEIFELVKKI